MAAQNQLMTMMAEIMENQSRAPPPSPQVDRFARNLKQGDRTLKEYRDDFHALSRYAPEGIEIYEKRKENFLKKLCDEMKVPFTVAYTSDYQGLLDQAIILEDNMKKTENRKRKLSINKNHSKSSFKKHFTHVVSHGHKYGNPHSGGSNHKHHEHDGLKGSNGDHKGNGHVGHNNNNVQHCPNHEYMDISQVLCYKCKNKGHYSNECPVKQKAEEAAKTNPLDKGHVNHINVEEVFEEPSIVHGTF